MLFRFAKLLHYYILMDTLLLINDRVRVWERTDLYWSSFKTKRHVLVKKMHIAKTLTKKAKNPKNR